MSGGQKPWSVADAIEGFYLAMAMDVLAREGVLEALGRGEPLDAIAVARELDLRVLRGLAELVAARTDLLAKTAAGQIVLGAGNQRGAAALLDLYVGGFGPCFQQLSATLRHPASGARWVDEQRHAAAFARAEAGSHPLVGTLVRELQIGTLLEIGCASGGLLLELADDEQFGGIGVDSNAHAIANARAQTAARGLSDRLTFVHGDMLVALAALAPEQRDAVDALYASSVFNGFFGWEGPTIDDVLTRLGELFPNRLLLLADYYGRLGVAAQGHEEGLGWVHDVAQLVSGQGVPPPDLGSWQAIYARTGGTFVQSFERKVEGVATFLHIVQLAGPA